MPNISEQMSETGGEGNIFKIWADSYGIVSRMWADTYEHLYKPWIESTGDIYSKAVDLSKNATEENYRDFYNEWMKTYQNTLSKFYPTITERPTKETLEKLAANAETTSNIFKSWASMLEEDTRKTKELLQGSPDPEKYREFLQMWMKTYEKIFQDFVTLPSMESTKELFEGYGAVPGIYYRSFADMSKLWRDSYSIYRPWVNSMTRLSEKMAEISRGQAGPEAYREFYNLWMDAYRETYGRLFNVQSARPSKEVLDSFLQSTDVYLSMYKSWLSSLEKMSEKTMELSRTTTDPEKYREFYNTWVRMYERAFNDFLRYMPTAGPMRNMMEPVKNAAKVYTDMFTNLANMWTKSTQGTASRA